MVSAGLCGLSGRSLQSPWVSAASVAGLHGSLQSPQEVSMGGLCGSLWEVSMGLCRRSQWVSVVSVGGLYGSLQEVSVGLHSLCGRSLQSIQVSAGVHSLWVSTGGLLT